MAKRPAPTRRAGLPMMQSHREETEMPAYAVQVVARPGRSRLDDSGIPDLFLRPLRNRWSRRKDWIILATILKTRDEHEWTALGNVLVQQLLSLGQYSGLLMDGDCLSDAAVNWLSSAMHSDATQVTEIKVMTEPHPMLGSQFTTNVTWASLQSSAGAVWLLTLWQHLGSQTFNHGADLLLAIYDEDVVSRFPWSKPLSIETFTKTLGDAIAWLIPLDENIGFILGLAGSSGLRTDLELKLETGSIESETVAAH